MCPFLSGMLFAIRRVMAADHGILTVLHNDVCQPASDRN